MLKKWGWLCIILLLGLGFVIIPNGCTTASQTGFDNFEVRVLGNNSFLAGSSGAMRVITYNPSDNSIVKNVPVALYLKHRDEKSEGAEGSKDSSSENVNLEDLGTKVYEGVTGNTGSVDASFAVPENAEGIAKLTVLTGRGDVTQKLETDITIQKQYKIYLTTDKPLYQPNQIIHIRALALNVPSLKPVADQELIIEVEDAKGNKVFKNTSGTSKFGISSAQFQLADEVNMGEFHVRAFLGKESAEKSVTVKKYVLPKFKVDFSKEKKFYSPGDTIKGDIQVDYFFGKPVVGGKVTIHLHTFDVEFRQAAEIKGVTDKSGHYSFELKIPDYLVGQPFEKGAAMSKLDIEVEDTADHKEKSVKMIPISKDGLSVDMIPEGGSLKPGMENIVYILSSYPDGSPAQASIEIKWQESSKLLTTDKSGLALFSIKPDSPANIYFSISATTPSGEKVVMDKVLTVSHGEDNIILRADKAQYKVGETVKFQILSTKSKSNYYLDIIRDRQTIGTRSFTAATSQHQFSMEATPDMMGLLSINAYMFTKDNNVVRDTRTIYVAPADDLKIKAEPDQNQYRPGDEAKINFTVSDKKGKGIAAALGIDIVDEAVFALEEMLPGLERVYFLLEKQLMEAKYEIHDFTLLEALTPIDKPDRDLQTLRQVLFTQIPAPPEYTVNLDTYANKIIQCYEKMSKIQQAMYDYNSKHNKFPGLGDINLLVKEGFLSEEDTVDPWGRKFYLYYRDNQEDKIPGIKSAGVSGISGDGDDLDYDTMASQFGYLFEQHFPGRRRFKNEEMDVMVFGAEPPMAVMEDAVVMRSMEKASAEAGSAAPEPSGGTAAVRIREYFPETLYTNPQVITDEHGKAQIGVTMADSITSWRMSVFGNTATGEMGNVQQGITVFQDFFIDIDFPVSLTQGDEVSVPIAIYNYLKESQTVKLSVEKGDWFEITQGGYEIQVELEKDQVKAVHIPIKILKLGRHRLTVHGMGTKLSDAIRREIEVLPDGEMKMITISDKIGQNVERYIDIPENSIADASRIFVSLYPGAISHVVDGMDKILRMPNGCFEQTSATTYPNVLVLDYLTRQKKLTPEIQMKAEGYINTGYQRLVSYEVQGGGFSWFGDAPANKVLTAFGILQFRDMSKVHEVDPLVITRTQQWLARQQNQDGSWSPDESYLHQESWSKMQGGGNIPVTAYIAWALAESGHRGSDLDKAMNYLKQNAQQLNDPYILSLVCNALASINPEDQTTQSMVKKLAGMAVQTADEAQWKTEMQTGTHSYGGPANMETTALAALALFKVKGNENLAGKALNYIIKNKDPYGTWHSTQATILAMKVLLLAQEKSTERINATIKITVNDKRTEEFIITPDNYDVFRQADFTDVTKNGKNKVVITVQGEGSCYFQIIGRYYSPWKTGHDPKKPLSIDVSYDRTTLKENDMLTQKVSVKNNTKAQMKMVMVDLGIAPGFTVMTPDLDSYVGKAFEKYTLTSRQVIIYIETIEPEQQIEFSYRLRAKYPLRVKTPESKTYQYYNPEVKDVSRPITLKVTQ